MTFRLVTDRIRRQARNLGAQSAAHLFLSARIVGRGIVREKATAQRAIPILNLHRVSTLFPRHPMTMLPTEFRRLLAGLQRVYRFISLRELDEILDHGHNRDDLACLTFDDCYGCNYTYAVPILCELGIPATFFVSTRYIDSVEPFPHDVATGHYDLPNFTSAQLRKMAELPSLEIGSHSVSHIDFSKRATAEDVTTELVASRAALEQITGRAVTRFAVPWGTVGHCTAQVIEAARAAGYVRVYSHFGGRNLVVPGTRTGYVLNRICSQGETPYVRACLEGYSGRYSFIPGRSERRRNWPREFHPTDVRWV